MHSLLLVIQIASTSVLNITYIHTEMGEHALLEGRLVSHTSTATPAYLSAHVQTAMIACDVAWSIAAAGTLARRDDVSEFLMLLVVARSLARDTVLMQSGTSHYFSVPSIGLFVVLSGEGADAL